MHKVSDVRAGDKNYSISISVSMIMFRQKVIYTNPYQKVIQPHITGITGLVKCVVCVLIA